MLRGRISGRRGRRSLHGQSNQPSSSAKISARFISPANCCNSILIVKSWAEGRRSFLPNRAAGPEPWGVESRRDGSGYPIVHNFPFHPTPSIAFHPPNPLIILASPLLTPKASNETKDVPPPLAPSWGLVFLTHSALAFDIRLVCWLYCASIWSFRDNVLMAAWW